MTNHMFDQPDTIVAQSTPQGAGAIGIVRLSGLRAIEIAGNIGRGREIARQASHTIQKVDIVDQHGAVIDQGMCAVFRSPHSYTGEDVVELYLHGSPYIIARVIELCCEAGARVAQPGEFTQRAFLNGKMDLAQAEAVADLVAARGEQALHAAVLQRGGALSRRIERIREEIIAISSLIELDIDFTEQDVPVTDWAQVEHQIHTIIDNLEVLARSFQRGRLAREGISVAIAGAPNAGKSTLFNALLGEDKALVHETPGTTRDAVEAVVEWGGVAVQLIDTAGQAEDFIGIDGEAVKRAKYTTKKADVVVWVVDLTSPEFPHIDDDRKEAVFIIGNKADLCREVDLSLYNTVCSAKSGQGVADIIDVITRKIALDDVGDTGEAVITRERHLQQVESAMASLRRALEALDGESKEALVALDLRAAADALGEIVGTITSDDVINRIFAEFCIGK